MKNLFLLLGVLSLAACGSKDNVSTSGDLPVLGGGGQGSTNPVDNVGGTPTKSTLIQVACQSSDGISLPNSQMSSGQRLIDMIPRVNGQESTSPTVLGVNGDIISALFVSGSKIYSANYDFARHEAAGEPQVIGSAGGASSDVYRALGFSRPRQAATSPDGRMFLLASGGGASLRSVANPDQAAARWKISGDFTQPRWDGNEIFVDKSSGGRLRQAVISVDVNGNQQGVKNAPSALSSSLHQIGLRRFDASSYIWLERSVSRAVLRVWNSDTSSVRNFELPNAKDLGPGFALIRTSPEAKARAVLNSRNGMHYFTLGANGTVELASYPYPEDTQTVIDNKESSVKFEPGAVYSAAGDTQLFAILPSTFGYKLLMAVDGSFGYRLLGFESCVNPDFYRTRN